MSSTINKSSLRERLDVASEVVNPRFSRYGSFLNRVKYCYVCGSRSEFRHAEIINPELAKEWNLTKRQKIRFDVRESTFCSVCTSSLRSNEHAKAICNVFAPGTKSLKEAVKTEGFKKLQVAEINSCGSLHEILKFLPNLSYSEYLSKKKDVPHQDLNKLTYEDNSFDLVLTSETLEHLPDWRRALMEIKRVLKPNAYHIFTTPTLLSRETRTRAKIEDGKLVNILPKSYHGCDPQEQDDYLVFNEFGADLLKQVDIIGFKTKLFDINIMDFNDPDFVYISKKQ